MGVQILAVLVSAIGIAKDDRLLLLLSVFLLSIPHPLSCCRKLGVEDVGIEVQDRVGLRLWIDARRCRCRLSILQTQSATLHGGHMAAIWRMSLSNMLGLALLRCE
jgi:hypothetical protein